MSSSTTRKPTLARLNRCQENLTAYIEHYITHMRPAATKNRPIDHLIICAGHPDPKILVTFCNAERFKFPCGSSLVRTRDPVLGKVHTVKKPIGGGGHETIQFNGVEYEIIMKEGPDERENWMDEEKFVALFDELGRAKKDVLFFDLVEFEENEARWRQEIEKGEKERAEEVERGERRKGKKKEKKQKQRARKAAAKAGVEVADSGVEVASSEDGDEAVVVAPESGGKAVTPEAQVGDAGKAETPEKKLTWAEKASFT